MLGCFWYDDDDDDDDDDGNDDDDDDDDNDDDDDDDDNEMMLITMTRWYQGFKETWITAFPFHKPLLYFACWGRTRLEDDLPIEQVSWILLLS